VAFRNYETNAAVDLVADIRARGITLPPSPVFDAEVRLAGGRLMLTPRGILGDLQQMPMLIGAGVAYLPPDDPASPRHKLIVWDHQRKVTWDPGTRGLMLIDDAHRELGDVVLRLRVPQEVDVLRLSTTTDSTPDSVWADSILVAYAMTRDGARPVYSWCPVKPSVFSLVESGSQEVTADQVVWTVQFKGEVTATFPQPVGSSRFESIQPQLLAGGQKTVSGLAVWPPKIIPAWRLYTLASENVFDGRIQADIWIGSPGRPPLRKATSAELLGTPKQPEGIRLNAQAPADAGPTFVELRRGDSVGYFELLTETLAADGGVTRVALDFGTSTTTVAASIADPPEALDLGPANALANPRVVFANAFENNRPSVDFVEPWIPSVRARYYGELLDLRQIPSGLFKRLDDGSPAAQLPFVGHTFVSSGFDLQKAFDAAARWNPDLKWGDTLPGGADDRKRFLTSVVVWVAALLRSSTREIVLRATYPLAFSRQRASTYRDVLDDVARVVKTLTGVTVTIPTPHYKDVESRRPFVDESTPLLRGAIEQFVIENAAGTRLVLVADLGGETLDVQLAALSPNELIHAFRIVACESVRIGANCAVEYLETLLNLPPQQTQNDTGEALLKRIKRTIISRIVRANRLGDALQARGPKFLDTELEWVPNGTQQLIRQLDCYFGLVAEYCARFVAGTLKNRSGLRDRIVNGPGAGTVREDIILPPNQKMSFAVQPFLVGNGWRTLQTFFDAFEGGPDATPEAWLRRVLFGRIRELLAPDDVESVIPSNGRLVLMDKTGTVLGTIDLEDAAPRASAATLSIVAAPNGFDDNVTNTPVDWSTLAGAGGQPIADGLQNLHLTNPPLPPPDRLMITQHGRARYEAFIRDVQIPSRREDWINVRTLQNAEKDPYRTDPRRDVSTARAAWESVFRPLLTK
jgi:hypothetical protein